MSLQVVPLSSSSQTTTVQLQVDGNPLTLVLVVKWSAMAGYWVMTIYDAQDNLLLDSIPLVTGWYPAANLLAQYGYLQIGSAHIINLGVDASDYPGSTDLGVGFILLWGDTAS